MESGEPGKTHRGSLHQILLAMQQKEPGAEARLFSVVYGELHHLARGRLARDPARASMQTTSLVHEAYFRLAGGTEVAWEDRGHFFGAAVRAMRQILVDRARKRNAIRRGGDKKRVSLDSNVPGSEPSVDVVALDEALTLLGKAYPRNAQVVEYRYFLGLTVKETAAELQISTRTVDSDWEFAKAWLKRELTQKN